MGRKRVVERYFDEAEEFAVLRYLETNDDREKNLIYNEILKGPFEKMIESIIKTYKLNRDDVTIEDLAVETMSHLFIKFGKFKPEKNKRAFSYYQTIVKNYLLGEAINSKKNRNRKIPFDNVTLEIEENLEFSYQIEDEPDLEIFDFIPKVIIKIKEELETGKKIKPNEYKVGYALIDILGNWENILSRDERSNVFARNKVLFEIREYTFLTSKDVRTAMKRFKLLYLEIYKENYL